MSDAMLFICATILVILFYGEPDLMSALIGWVQSVSEATP
jgi:hypothetical protein